MGAEETAEFFALNKAKEVFARYSDCVVLGADTVVSLDGEILGKPKDADDAKATLRRLSGRVHAVYTGVALLFEGGCHSVCVKTEVYFHQLSDRLIEEYVASGSPLDKAGSYGIQDGYPLVKEISGSYTNVVGLPVEALGELMKEVGLC